MAQSKSDGFSVFDEMLASANRGSPWRDSQYFPDTDLLVSLLCVPIGQGDKQESGRAAKAIDAWIANELRRAGFPAEAVWPRARRPRVLAEDLGRVEESLDRLREQLHAFENAQGGRGSNSRPLRKAIRDVGRSLPGGSEAYILGDFYSKQIDVGLSSWRRGPDILISTKTMFTSYRKNLKNRHEEAVGEVYSLRRRHPMATMGYAYLVHRSIYDEDGAYGILQDILSRLRRPGEAFDATMLLVAYWDESEDRPVVSHIDQPDEDLSAGRFFGEIVSFVEERTPIREHQGVRRRRGGEPVGGLPLGVVDDDDGNPSLAIDPAPDEDVDSSSGEDDGTVL